MSILFVIEVTVMVIKTFKKFRSFELHNPRNGHFWIQFFVIEVAEHENWKFPTLLKILFCFLAKLLPLQVIFETIFHMLPQLHQLYLYQTCAFVLSTT